MAGGGKVTIYGSNDDTGLTCSSTVLEFATRAHCYNRSWIYYSIDNCIPQDKEPSSSSSAASDNSSPAGAIAGGVVGGIAALGALGGAFFYLRRKRKLGRKLETQQNERPPEELSTLPRVEMPADSRSERKYELASEGPLPELFGVRSPVEMEGDTGFPDAPERGPTPSRGEGDGEVEGSGK